MIIRRPSLPDQARGVLGREHFQIAYATNDIARAMETFRAKFGISEFRALEGPLPRGGHIHIELAWVGNLMYELLTASGPGSEPFTRGLPADSYALRHHHLGYLVRDAADWEALQSDIAAGGWAITHAGDNPGFMRTCIVEVPDLGHALEFIWAAEAGRAFFESVPVVRSAA